MKLNEKKRLNGVWKLIQYFHDDEEVDWTGMLIITRSSCCHNVMANKRPSVPERWLAEPTAEEKNDLVEALYQKYGALSGTYEVENGTLIYKPSAVGNPALLGQKLDRQFELNEDGTQLTLTGERKIRGHTVKEVWKKVEDLD